MIRVTFIGPWVLLQLIPVDKKLSECAHPNSIHGNRGNQNGELGYSNSFPFSV